MADAGAHGGQTAGRCYEEHGLVKLAHETLGPSYLNREVHCIECGHTCNRCTAPNCTTSSGDPEWHADFASKAGSDSPHPLQVHDRCPLPVGTRTPGRGHGIPGPVTRLPPGGRVSRPARRLRQMGDHATAPVSASLLLSFPTGQGRWSIAAAQGSGNSCNCAAVSAFPQISCTGQ